MDSYRPLRVCLFFYECLRLLLLAVFLLIAPLEGFVMGAFFPYIVFLSANALFPLMALFIWLKPEEYQDYLTLYMAGKIIGAVSFFAWEVFSSREFPGVENVAKGIILLGGSVFICLADILCVWGVWTLKRKYLPLERQIPTQ